MMVVLKYNFFCVRDSSGTPQLRWHARVHEEYKRPEASGSPTWSR